MSFVSRYTNDISPAIDWATLCLAADLTVIEAIAVWRDYFQARLIDPQTHCRPLVLLSCSATKPWWDCCLISSWLRLCGWISLPTRRRSIVFVFLLIPL